MPSFIDDLQALSGKKKEAAGSAEHKRILIVEDEKPLADALEGELQSEGFDTAKAENGQKGLEKMETFKPHLILLDLIMPVMDGKTMLRKLRGMSEYKYLPVIVLTNAGEVENIHETQTFDNAVEFLVKSNVTMDSIVQRVKMLVL